MKNNPECKLDGIIRFCNLTIFFTTIALLIPAFLSCNRQNNSETVGQDYQITVCGTVQFTDGCGPKPDSLISLGLAEKAINAANNYSAIAPDVAHALHMPTHIYTRLGMWDESIDWNKRAAEAALKQPVQGAVSAHYYHSIDYIVYAHLQKLEDIQVEKILNEIKKMESPIQQAPATAYTLAAIEGRFALERQNWKKAAQLEARKPTLVNWDDFPDFETLSYYTIGLGAARSGDNKKADLAMQNMKSLKQKIKSPYWANQVDIQMQIVKAWSFLSEGNKEAALETMKLATEMEMATNKHPITPGELLPASELMGDMLMETGNPTEALIYYEQALSRSPGRFNSIYGAGKAAESSGNMPKAIEYFEALIAISQKAEAFNPKRQYAMTFLNN